MKAAAAGRIDAPRRASSTLPACTEYPAMPQRELACVPLSPERTSRIRSKRCFTVRAIAAGASSGIAKHELALISHRT